MYTQFIPKIYSHFYMLFIIFFLLITSYIFFIVLFTTFLYLSFYLHSFLVYIFDIIINLLGLNL